MEYIDIVDENGNPTGETTTRENAHLNGLRHRTSHVWIARKKDGKPQLLLQKRCMQKDSYPGCYDISSAGHITAGDEYVHSALRELGEELKVSAEAKDLLEVGMRSCGSDHVFHGIPYHDKQVCKVFLLWVDQEAEDFVPQPEEIESVMWMDYEECIKAVQQGTIPNCIYVEELEMLRPYLF